MGDDEQGCHAFTIDLKMGFAYDVDSPRKSGKRGGVLEERTLNGDQIVRGGQFCGGERLTIKPVDNAGGDRVFDHTVRLVVEDAVHAAFFVAGAGPTAPSTTALAALQRAANNAVGVLALDADNLGVSAAIDGFHDARTLCFSSHRRGTMRRGKRRGQTDDVLCPPICVSQS